MLTAAADAHAFFKEHILPDLQVTDARRLELARTKQLGPAWFAAHLKRLSASKFGAAAGHGDAGTQRRALHDMLWPELAVLTGRSAAYAAYGTATEPVARADYVADRARGCAAAGFAKGPVVVDAGLLVSSQHCWLAASPDFFIREEPPVHERGDAVFTTLHLIVHPPGQATIAAAPAHETEPTEEAGLPAVGGGEIKCPAKRKLYTGNPKHARFGIPHKDYDQVQGAMAIGAFSWWDYITYTPAVTEVRRIRYDQPYWEGELLPALARFYFQDFVPRLQLREQGRLRPGHVDPVAVLCVLPQPPELDETDKAAAVAVAPAVVVVVVPPAAAASTRTTRKRYRDTVLALPPLPQLP